MKLKAVLLAAATLLSVAFASAPEPASSAISAGVNNGRHADLDTVNVAPAPKATKPCETNCYFALRKCANDCGGGAFCEDGCKCALFSDSNLECVRPGCFQLPDNCDIFNSTGRVIAHDATASVIDAPDAVALEARASNTPKPKKSQCQRHCDDPYYMCERECKKYGLASCDRICNCGMFNDPNFICIRKKCTKLPENCPPKSHGMSFHDGENGLWLSELFFGANEENGIPSADILPRAQPAETSDHSAAQTGSGGLPRPPMMLNPPPQSPCDICSASFKTCAANCAGGIECDDTCHCLLSAHHSCEKCGFKCVKGTLPRDVAPACRGEETESKTECDDKLARQLNEPPGLPPNIHLPPIFTLYSICVSAIDACKRKCPQGSCDEHCACYHARHDQACIAVSYPCKDSIYEGKKLMDRNNTGPMEDGDSLPDPQTGLPVPPPPNLLCMAAINHCKKNCHGDELCQDKCDCVSGSLAQCKEAKIKCKAENKPNNDVCMRSITQCQNECAQEGSCHDACVCYYKEDSLCWGVNLDCGCARCHRLLAIQR